MIAEVEQLDYLPGYRKNLLTEIMNSKNSLSRREELLFVIALQLEALLSR